MANDAEPLFICGPCRAAGAPAEGPLLWPKDEGLSPNPPKGRVLGVC